MTATSVVGLVLMLAPLAGIVAFVAGLFVQHLFEAVREREWGAVAFFVGVVSVFVGMALFSFGAGR